MLNTKLSVNALSFEVFRYNDATLGAEAPILTETGVDTDLTLMTRFNENGDDPQFRLLEVM